MLELLFGVGYYVLAFGGKANLEEFALYFGQDIWRPD
ncbi:hypothetical protein ES703_78430 [subsurface metagenome]